MKLSGVPFDLGVRSGDLDAMTAFWRDDVGLEPAGMRKVREGQEQHRFALNGGLLKINYHSNGLEPHPAAGYREIIVVDERYATPKHLADPEGVQVTLAPPGYEGVSQIGVRIGVVDLEGHRRFYREVLQLPEAAAGVFAAGPSTILLEADPTAVRDAEMYGSGFRYITFVVKDGVDEHNRLLAAGTTEGWVPMIANTDTVISVSMVRDPDGNWIELLERP